MSWNEPKRRSESCGLAVTDLGKHVLQPGLLLRGQTLVTRTLLAHLRQLAGTTLVGKGQVEQVIMNLAVNARDAMPTGGTLTLQTSTRELTEEDASAYVEARAGNFVVLSISDTGIGIPESDLSHIFDRFYRCDPSRSQTGSGLGLSLARAIARAHDGDITVVSIPNQGSTFTITLPKTNLQRRL